MAETESPDIEEPTEELGPEDDLGLDKEIDVRVTNVNLAVDLHEDDDQVLIDIGQQCKQGFDVDNGSRDDWLNDTEEWLDLAKQVRDEKNFPWRKASNVKYPLISVAALQFAARSYPTLVPSDGKLVKTRVIGKDPTGEKGKKGERIATYMSWQFMYDMENWDEDMDRLLIMLPVAGMVFKKTFYDTHCDKIVSRLVYPENFVIDYWADSLENAERYSEIVYMTEREYLERVGAGEYIKQDLGMPVRQENGSAAYATNSLDSVMPYKFIEQYTWLDLDDDEVKEPYIVTFHHESAKVISIRPRYVPAGIKEKDGKILSIEPLQFYTKYSFIPNPDGSFYDLGFGHLLGPINEAVNTLVNQLIDAGHLYTLQSGFIGKGLRLKMGEQAFKPGEWKAVNATGEDLQRQIVPLPTKEPSGVLFQLLGMLISSGKELASVAEIFTGKMPGQNTPATTTMATVEQGMKVFTAVYKRVYRAMQKEFKKVYKLNSYYLDPNTYSTVLDEQINPEDFDDNKTYDICPTADPTATTQTERLMKAQALMEMMPLGTLDPIEVTKRMLEAQDQPNWEKLIPGLAETGQPTPKEPPPDPKLQLMQQQAQISAQESQQKMELMQQKSANDQRTAEFRAQQEAQSQAQERAHRERLAEVEATGAQNKQRIFMAEGLQKMNMSAMEHAQKLKQSEEIAKSKQTSQEKTTSSGKTTQSQSRSKKK